MNFVFTPAGIPISSSYAISASIAANTDVLPATASSAGYTLLPVGPTGSDYTSSWAAGLI